MPGGYYTLLYYYHYGLALTRRWLAPYTRAPPPLPHTDILRSPRVIRARARAGRPRAFVALYTLISYSSLYSCSSSSSLWVAAASGSKGSREAFVPDSPIRFCCRCSSRARAPPPFHYIARAHTSLVVPPRRAWNLVFSRGAPGSTCVFSCVYQYSIYIIPLALTMTLSLYLYVYSL